jgi:hypothetical protein
MKHAVFLLLLSALSLLADEKWPGVAFTEVRAYAWKPSKTDDAEALILEDKSFVPGVINPEGAFLTPEEVKQLFAAITGRHQGYFGLTCYLPHNAFVFYDAAKKPVAFYEVCFTCLGHRAEPRKGLAANINFPALAAIFAAHKLPFGSGKDAAEFKKRFDSSLIKEEAEPPEK